MADPLELYNAELKKRSGPFGTERADTFGGKLLQGLGYGAESVIDFGESLGLIGSPYGPFMGPAMKIAEPIVEKLAEPTEYGSQKIQAEAEAARLAQQAELQKLIEADPTLLGKFGGLESVVDIPQIDMSGLEDFTTGAEYQAAAKKKKGEEAEAFRKTEKQLVDSQGGLNSMSVADSTAITKENIEQASIAAMNDYIEAARGAGPEVSPVKDIKDYKEKFAEATGIDISGEVDKSHALMTFGLALMQNKAGKGFNVGKMLTATGAAGEKAMPALQKARERSRLDGIAAGKYALEAQSADEAIARAANEKAMERGNYFVVPKANDMKGFLANLSTGQGRLESLSKYELDKLRKDPEFSSKFDVLPGSTWSSVVSEAMKAPEAKQFYDTKAPRKIELFGEGAGNMFTIETWRALPQSGKENLLVGTGQSAYEGLSRAARDIAKAKDKFVTGLGLAEGVGVFRFSLDKVDSLASAFGINVKKGTNNTEKLKLFLTKLQAQNAKEILGEAGKTISDADRALVKSIVGDVGLFSNPDLLEQKVGELFQEIVVKKEQQILDALGTLDRYSGRDVSSRLGSGTLNDKEQAELERYLASPEFSSGGKN